LTPKRPAGNWAGALPWPGTAKPTFSTPAGAALIPNLASVHPAFILIGMVTLFIFFAQVMHIAIIFDQRWDALFGNPATLQEPG